MNATERARIFYQCRDEEDFYLDKCENCKYLKFDDLDYFHPYCDYGRKCKITDMRGEERTKYVVCSQCAFWDYEKNCCSEWFRHKIPTGSLHRCADMRGEE